LQIQISFNNICVIIVQKKEIYKNNKYQMYFAIKIIIKIIYHISIKNPQLVKILNKY